MPVKMEVVKKTFADASVSLQNVYLSKILNNRPITFLLSDRILLHTELLSKTTFIFKEYSLLIRQGSYYEAPTVPYDPRHVRVFPPIATFSRGRGRGEGEGRGLYVGVHVDRT